MQNQRSVGPIIVAVILGVLLVLVSVLWISTLASNSDLEQNFDDKVATEVAVAVQDAESAKDVEFLEKEKQPNRVYTGSATYGSLTFSYPKTWSVYVQESASGTLLDVYAHPDVVPGLQSLQPYALRAEILSQSYETVASRFNSQIEQGTLTANAFRPAKVPESLGLLLNGEIENGVQGQMVVLPLRDRTIQIYTESQEFANDFLNTVVPSIEFVP